ncbi:kinase-like protein, partial [Corynespora cassiicola Philippines]
FIKAQGLILTNEMGLEKGKDGSHCHFEKSDNLPFEERGIIGSGGFAQVDKVFTLLMTPIADMDLSVYMRSYQETRRYELGTFFGCLARALEFLHQQKVRHKDIKPSNILVSKGNVLFTDFGPSLDFADASGSTTASMVNGKTPRYCAPEVALDEPRNTMSDIWSLGIVFLEIIVVLKGKKPKYMDEFFDTHGS